MYEKLNYKADTMCKSIKVSILQNKTNERQIRPYTHICTSKLLGLKQPK